MASTNANGFDAPASDDTAYKAETVGQAKARLPATTMFALACRPRGPA